MSADEQKADEWDGVIRDEIPDKYAALARVLWDELRKTGFHNGRNRVARHFREAAHAQDAEVERLRAECARKDEAIKWHFEECAFEAHKCPLDSALSTDSGWLARKLDEAISRRLQEIAGWFRAWKDMPASYERAAEALDRFADEAAQARARSNHDAKAK